MLKHISDDGNLNMILNDDGEFLVVCEKCKKVWTGGFSAATHSFVSNLIGSSKQAESMVLGELNVDMESLV